ncbi:MAG: S9 family peptidase [Betaproteobacteria bacterium]|nr:S9 family peptidase [Betaproteobacteria bacterium]
MPKAKPPSRRKPQHLTVEALWQLQRLGAPSLSPDGAQAVISATAYSMKENKSSSRLWLLSTLGGEPRALTQCGDKDSQPRWSPARAGDGERSQLIAFTARREQDSRKDDAPQIYLINADGGEARRAADIATGVEAFKWFPDAKRLAFVSWIWPDTRGARAQTTRLKDWRERKESAYTTEEAQYRYWDHHLPQDRVAHLHLLTLGADEASAKVVDLFEGTPYELSRAEPDAHTFDISPDGRRIVFAFDPAPQKRMDGRYALAEMDIKTRRVTVIARDAQWDFSAPRYSADGNQIAFLASHQGRKHTMPAQLALWSRKQGWQVLSAKWDHEVNAPLQWADDGLSVLFTAEEEGRQHLWRWTLDKGTAEVVANGGWVQAFDACGDVLVTVADGVDHPAQVHASVDQQAPRRIEDFNDAVLKPIAMGHTEEIWISGAQGDRVQLWVTYPPDFNPKKKYPLLQIIHGGPHTAFGDAFHYRWNVQTFAAQGYVVASVNYHGSSSFGYAFKDSISGHWGELELQDVEAATDALLKKPWADRKRVFAAGGSYGGFMAAWMNGHVKPGRYAAYICHAGCFDWTAMFADDAYTWHAKELGAWYWDDMARVHAQSPHAFARHMKTPTLVIHGQLDYRVPDAQGLAYYNTLKARGVEARLVWFPDENHWILKPRNSRLWYGEFFGWLRRHDVDTQRAKPTARASTKPASRRKAQGLTDHA